MQTQKRNSKETHQIWITLNHCHCWLLLQPSNWKPLWRPSGLARSFQDLCNLQRWLTPTFLLSHTVCSCVQCLAYFYCFGPSCHCNEISHLRLSRREKTSQHCATIDSFSLSLFDIFESCWIMSNSVKSEYVDSFLNPLVLGCCTPARLSLSSWIMRSSSRQVLLLAPNFKDIGHWAVESSPASNKEWPGTWHHMAPHVPWWKRALSCDILWPNPFMAVLANDPQQKLCLWIHSCNLAQLHVIVKWHEANASTSGDAGIPGIPLYTKYW